MTETQRYNCFTRNGGNAIPKNTGPEAKVSNPTAGLTLLWARSPFSENFNHWQVSRKEAGQTFFKRRRRNSSAIYRLLLGGKSHSVFYPYKTGKANKNVPD